MATKADLQAAQQYLSQVGMTPGSHPGYLNADGTPTSVGYNYANEAIGGNLSAFDSIEDPAARAAKASQDIQAAKDYLTGIGMSQSSRPAFFNPDGTPSLAGYEYANEGLDGKLSPYLKDNSFESVLQTLGQNTYRTPTQLGQRYDKDSGEWVNVTGGTDDLVGGQRTIDLAAAGQDPRLGPNPQSYGSGWSWNEWAKRNGANADWTQATPESKAAYDAEIVKNFPSKDSGGIGGLIKGIMGDPVLGPAAGLLATGLAGVWGPAAVGESVAAGAAGGAGAGLGGGGGVLASGGLSAADTLGLQQMGQAAGLSGQALTDFVASGGALGSTAAGGGGIGLGALGQQPSLGLGSLNPNVPVGPGTDVAAATGAQTSGAGILDSAGIGAAGPTVTNAATAGLGAVGAVGAGGGGGSGSGATSASSTAFQRIMDGTATAADWASIAGTVGATGLGMYNDYQKNKSQEELANQFMQFGAPSRARYESSFAPGFNVGAADPAFQALKDQTQEGLLRKLSATSGNPYGSPGGLIEANKQIGASLDAPWLQNYRNQNAATGGYGAFNTAAPGAAAGALNSQGGALTTLAGGVSDILNPRPQQPSLADLMKIFGGNSSTLV